mmetsp:Transcript_84095/g.271126  ORF Transcript_84095/g.271126 Transcript_84095/m.271126 type:complete len:203 (-) Transcript_84095:115-723(-)
MESSAVRAAAALEALPRTTDGTSDSGIESEMEPLEVFLAVPLRTDRELAEGIEPSEMPDPPRTDPDLELGSTSSEMESSVRLGGFLDRAAGGSDRCGPELPEADTDPDALAFESSDSASKSSTAEYSDEAPLREADAEAAALGRFARPSRPSPSAGMEEKPASRSTTSRKCSLQRTCVARFSASSCSKAALCSAHCNSSLLF